MAMSAGASALSLKCPTSDLPPALTKCVNGASHRRRAASFGASEISTDFGRAWGAQGQALSSPRLYTAGLSMCFRNSWITRKCLRASTRQQRQGISWSGSSFHSVWNPRLIQSTKPLEKRSAAICTASMGGPDTVQVAANLFQLGTAVVIPFYTVMILAPRSEMTQKIMESELIYFILGAGYIYLLALSWTPQTLGLMFASKYWLPELSGITQMFTCTVSVASAWLHLLAVDLFAGRQIFLDGLTHKIETRHSLVLCLMMCPIGIFTHLFTKAVVLFFRGAKGDPSKEVRNQFPSY